MAIKMTTSPEALDRFLMAAFTIIRNEVSNALAKLGVECVAKIRDRSSKESWIDHTGNLRSSIGFAVYDHGLKKVQSSFQTIMGGSEGSSEGKKMINNLANEYSKVYALVVVAGMNYAEYVESLESKDVLASTELWAKDVIDARLERAKKSALANIEKLSL